MNRIDEFELGMTYLHMAIYVEDASLVTGILLTAAWPNAIRTDDGRVFERVEGPLDYDQYRTARACIEGIATNTARIKELQQGIEDASNALWDIAEEAGDTRIAIAAEIAAHFEEAQ